MRKNRFVYMPSSPFIIIYRHRTMVKFGFTDGRNLAISQENDYYFVLSTMFFDGGVHFFNCFSYIGFHDVFWWYGGGGIL